MEARSQTYLRFFQRALLPGPYGALVQAETVVPIYQYVSARARSANAPWKAHSIDAEVSAWGNYQFADVPTRERFDADVTTAQLTQRFEQAYLRLGRQAVSAGAARYVRFDGVSAGTHALRWGGAQAYAGWSVLPRWDGRPGYAHLGSPVESLVRSPEALPDAGRSGTWLSGARFEWRPSAAWLTALSFHDERQAGELARQQLGLDVRLQPSQQIVGSAQAIIDTETQRLAEGRAYVDFIPWPELLLDLEYLRTRPSLYLSRQSVLSVFGTNTFDEVGAEAVYRPWRHWVATASGHIERFLPGVYGARAELQLRATVDESQRLEVQGGYSRVSASDNAYHALRSSLRYRATTQLTAVGEAYWYVYDEPVALHTSSSVYASNFEWRLGAATSLLWGVSLAQTPYARSDLQTLIRATHDFGTGLGR